jgi:hypothetical protein
VENQNKHNEMKKTAKKHWRTIIGIAAGAAAGYFYWQQIGCSSGGCAITSSPINSTIYGAIMGGAILSLFSKNDKAAV